MATSVSPERQLEQRGKPASSINVSVVMVSSEEKRVYTVTAPYLTYNCQLGESILFDQASNTLSFLDIPTRELHSIDLTQGALSHRCIPIEHSVHKIVPIAGQPSVFLSGSNSDFALLDQRTGRIVPLKSLYSDAEIAEGKAAGFATNDGIVDSKGRFLLSKIPMPPNRKNTNGGLFRLDADFSVHPITPTGLSIPNGLAFSPDDQTIYLTDSAVGLYSFPTSLPTFEPSPKDLFFSPRDYGLSGGSDGCAMDADGFLWLAIYGAGKILRVSPVGDVVAEVQLPTPCPTDVCFAGEDLFITTARPSPALVRNAKGLNEDPLQGCVFRIHVGVKGRKLNQFVCDPALLEPKLAELRMPRASL